MDGETLDLNNPKDARRYVLLWVDHGEIEYQKPKQLIHGTDADWLRVAKQLFLYCDPRQALGEAH